MAKKKDANGAGHNSDANRDVMIEVAGELRAIKDARAALTEQAGEARKRLRDAGIEPKAFEFALRMADLEDDAARNNYMNALRESWAVLEVGGQMDFLAQEIVGGEHDEVSEPEAQ